MVLRGMDTYRDIIGLWPSLREFADDIGVRYGTAQVMRYRNQLKDEHWQAVVAAASRRGLPVTLDILARIAASRRGLPKNCTDRPARTTGEAA